MLLIEPDFTRRIDLPGAGPCPRPVDIDQSVTGFADLVSFRVYAFAAGVTIHGEAEGDELFIVLMRGTIDLAVREGGEQVGVFSLDTGGESRAIYMPPGSEYYLTAQGDADVAYARVRGEAATTRRTKVFSSADGRTLGQAAGMTFALTSLKPGAVLDLAPSGSPAPERLVHLRSSGAGRAEIGGRPLGDWQTAVIGCGADAVLTVDDGLVDILLVSAAV